MLFQDRETTEDLIETKIEIGKAAVECGAVIRLEEGEWIESVKCGRGTTGNPAVCVIEGVLVEKINTSPCPPFHYPLT